jgi:hypothetical protein
MLRQTPTSPNQKIAKQSATALLLTALLAITSITRAAESEWPTPSVTRLENTSPTRILFMGNSYMYYNDSLHNHVKRIIDELQPELGKKLQFKSATIGGSRLKHHAYEWLLTPGQIGISRPFQLIVMQGGSMEMFGSENQQGYLDSVTAIAAHMRSLGGESAVYMTHAYVPPHRNAAPGLINDIAPTTISAGNAAGALVIPTGLAFEESYKHRPELLLHEHFDGTHPNLYGTYLAACVVYLSVYRRPIDDLTYNYFGEIPDDIAAYLRQVATYTVVNFFNQAETAQN